MGNLTDIGYGVGKYLTESDASGIPGIASNRTNLDLLNFKVATNNAYAFYTFKDGMIDAYVGETGVDTGASTNEVYNAAGDYYSGSDTANATGGTITTDGSDTIHSFATAGNGSGTNNFVAPGTNTAVEWLVVAGGAGGGAGRGGGGGAGGYIAQTGQTVTAGTHAVVAGAGGTGGATEGDNGANGANSTIGSLVTATGGGGGGGYANPTSFGQPGGSGGGQGGSEGGGGSAGSASPAGQGNPGGLDASQNEGGGGGGAGQTGGNASGGDGGTGGNGLANDITGSSVTYGGGGGGGSNNSTTSPGGSGGGGQGRYDGAGGGGGNGTDGLGGGGGGGADGGDGGNGIVIARYATDSFLVNNDMTLISAAQTATAEPDTGRLMLYEETSTGSTTLNTDLKGYVSRDNGTTYTAVTLATDTTYETGKTLVSGSVDISGQPSGTSIRYKIETLNQSASKVCRLHGASVLWA